MSVQSVKKDRLKFLLDGRDEFVAQVQSGSEVEVECEINCNGGLVTSPDSVIRAEDIVFPYVNPVTGPIDVAGAKAGQVLAVKILGMDLADVGYTGWSSRAGLFPNWIFGDQSGDSTTRVVGISDGMIHWDEKRRIPVAPMIGVLGVAPAFGNISSIDNGDHGGNLDVQEITVGATVYLPIHNDGAYLYMGDCHARQGDGEISGMGPVEVAARVTVGVEVVERPARMTWPRFEDETHIGTIGCGRTFEDAMRISYREILYWLADDYGFSEPDAYMFLSAVAEGRATQVVNPKITYVCKIDKRFLK